LRRRARPLEEASQRRRPSPAFRLLHACAEPRLLLGAPLGLLQGLREDRAARLCGVAMGVFLDPGLFEPFDVVARPLVAEHVDQRGEHGPFGEERAVSENAESVEAVKHPEHEVVAPAEEILDRREDAVPLAPLAEGVREVRVDAVRLEFFLAGHHARAQGRMTVAIGNA